MCASQPHIGRRRTAVCVCVCVWTGNAKGVNEDVPKRGKRREMGWKETPRLLLPGECQVICFVIPPHIFYSKEGGEKDRDRDRDRRREEGLSSYRKRNAAAFSSPCCINNDNNSSSILVCCCRCCCCCCCCSALCSRC
jgi:hypothetical protein